MDESWLNRLTKKLSHSDFTSVSEGWVVKGLNHSAVINNGWHGAFSLYDLNEAMKIEEVQQVVYDPFILDVLQETLGAPPVVRAVDVYMHVPKKDGSATHFSFDTRHKDFNSARSIKVFVYLTDALDKDHGPLRIFHLRKMIWGQLLSLATSSNRVVLMTSKTTPI
jgi:hypothetical protein